MTGKNLVKTIGLITALALGGNVYAQSKPKIIATIETPYDLFFYTSNRPDENRGKVFSYNILEDGTIQQADKPNIKFARTWFYDIDGDGQFGKAEREAIKKGTLVIMHPEFNSTADERLNQGKHYRKHVSEGEEPTITYDDKGRKTEWGKVPYIVKKTDLSEDVGGYPYNERIAQKNDYNPAADEPIVKDKVKPVYSLIVGANTNKDLDYLTGSLGLRVNPFRNERIGFGLNLDAGLGKDKEIESDYFKFSEGEEYFGKINEINNNSIGASGELQLYNFIFGGGFDYRKNISETNERLIRGEEVLDSSSNSTQEGNFYGKAYAGLEFQPTKRLGIGATVGYHQKDGLQFGTRAIIKLNKRR